MDNLDIRWKQRFANYEMAFQKLKEVIEMFNIDSSDILLETIIHRFEYNYELAWNVMNDYFIYQAEDNVNGSRDAIKLAFKRGLITDGENWMEMIKDRIASVHTYNQETTKILAHKIKFLYFPLFLNFEIKMKTLL